MAPVWVLVFGLLYRGPVNVLATGGYGYGNFGDECYVDILQSRMSTRLIDIIPRVDESDLRLHSYDLTMLAGGGLLYHHLSKAGDESLKHYLRYPAIAQWLGKKSFLISLGAQGSIQPENFASYVHTLENLDLRTVRDGYSARLLRDSGLRSSVLECADLFYTYPIPSLPKDSRRSGSSISSKPTLAVVASQPGVGYFYSEFSGFEDRVYRALRILEKDFRIHFFSFDNRFDTWLAESWSGDCSYTKFDSANSNGTVEFIEAFRTTDVCLTTRYHGAILSTLLGTPYLAVGAPSEKLQRECEILGYSQFLSYTATADQIVKSIRAIWDGRDALSDQLKLVVPHRKRLAIRNFELMDSEIVFPERNGSRMIPQIAASIEQSSSFRTLVVWAAGANCWHEASGLFNRLSNFDCILPPKSSLRHRFLGQRFILPDPGVFNWSALPQELKGRLQKNYDNVIACHEGTASKARDLLEVASAAGTRIWEFDVWKHSVRCISEADSAMHRRQQAPIEEVTA
jgi:polysaccharide pyruvyl transferase WcaK-like protein